MLAPSHVREFVVSYGMNLLSLPAMVSTQLPYNARDNWALILNPQAVLFR